MTDIIIILMSTIITDNDKLNDILYGYSLPLGGPRKSRNS